jgi:hypothetical protein
MKNKRIHILTGGLGNQLFQYASALYFNEDRDFILELRLGNPRSQTKDLPDLYGFNVEELAPHQKSLTANWFSSKTMGYLLRSNYLPKGIEFNNSFRFLTKSLASFVMSITYLKPLRATSPRNLGYDENLSLPTESYVVNGYFQSWRYPFDTNIRKRMRTLELKHPSSEISGFQKLAKTELPLVVHVRLGDYINQTNFGIPSKEYYESAIEKCWSNGNFSKIWLFSDDPDEAFTIIPERFSKYVRVIELKDKLPAATLEVFRMGEGYVLANSSFSWWGAFLSYHDDPMVITPDPWFQSGPNPKDLIPPKWELLAAAE